MMESHAKLAGHAIHQQLVAFPLGLLATAFVFDVIGFLGRDGRFHVASYLMIAAGVLTGLLAAVFGLIDFLAVPRGSRAKRVAAIHGTGNVAVVLLFLISWRPGGRRLRARPRGLPHRRHHGLAGRRARGAARRRGRRRCRD